MTKTIGYKAMELDMTCRGFQFEIGKTYTVGNNIPLEEHFDRNFDFYLELENVFNYYDYTNCRVFEVETESEVVTEGNKSITKTLMIKREITHEELKKQQQTFKKSKIILYLFASIIIVSMFLSIGNKIFFWISGALVFLFICLFIYLCKEDLENSSKRLTEEEKIRICELYALTCNISGPNFGQISIRNNIVKLDKFNGITNKHFNWIKERKKEEIENLINVYRENIENTLNDLTIKMNNTTNNYHKLIYQNEINETLKNETYSSIILDEKIPIYIY